MFPVVAAPASIAAIIIDATLALLFVAGVVTQLGCVKSDMFIVCVPAVVLVGSSNAKPVPKFVRAGSPKTILIGLFD
jgi:hypothetical protein